MIEYGKLTCLNEINLKRIDKRQVGWKWIVNDWNCCCCLNIIDHQALNFGLRERFLQDIQVVEVGVGVHVAGVGVTAANVAQVSCDWISGVRASASRHQSVDVNDRAGACRADHTVGHVDPCAQGGLRIRHDRDVVVIAGNHHLMERIAGGALRDAENDQIAAVGGRAAVDDARPIRIALRVEPRGHGVVARHVNGGGRQEVARVQVDRLAGGALAIGDPRVAGAGTQGEASAAVHSGRVESPVILHVGEPCVCGRRGR